MPRICSFGDQVQVTSFHKTWVLTMTQGLPRWHSGKEATCQCRRHNRCGFNPWAGKTPWSRLQYTCLEDSMDRGHWKVIWSMGVSKSQTRLMPENTLCATCWGNSEQETKSLILLSLTVLDLQNPYSVVTVSDFQIEGKIEAQRWGCIVYLCLRHTASSMLMILRHTYFYIFTFLISKCIAWNGVFALLLF